MKPQVKRGPLQRPVGDLRKPVPHRKIIPERGACKGPGPQVPETVRQNDNSVKINAGKRPVSDHFHRPRHNHGFHHHIVPPEDISRAGSGNCPISSSLPVRPAGIRTSSSVSSAVGGRMRSDVDLLNRQPSKLVRRDQRLIHRRFRQIYRRNGRRIPLSVSVFIKDIVGVGKTLLIVIRFLHEPGLKDNHLVFFLHSHCLPFFRPDETWPGECRGQGQGRSRPQNPLPMLNNFSLHKQNPP